jgi:hypothetical protein
MTVGVLFILLGPVDAIMFGQDPRHLRPVDIPSSDLEEAQTSIELIGGVVQFVTYAVPVFVSQFYPSSS